MKRFVGPVSVLVVGLFMLGAAVAGLATRGDNGDVVAAGRVRTVLWYPIGETASCVQNQRVHACSGTLIGNINEHDRVVARSVPLMADTDAFHWTITPQQVEAQNRRNTSGYLACMNAGRPNCVLTRDHVPSWSSGMRVQWAPGLDGAYLLGDSPSHGRDGLWPPILTLVAGILLTTAGAWWLVAEVRRHGRRG